MKENFMKCKFLIAFNFSILFLIIGCNTENTSSKVAISNSYENVGKYQHTTNITRVSNSQNNVRKCQQSQNKTSVFGSEASVRKCGNSQNKAAVSVSSENTQDSQSSNEVLEFVSTEPANPAVLLVGEKLNVTAFYELKSLKKAAIWTRPYANGEIAPNYGAHGLISVSNEPNDSGFVTGWFYLSKPAEIDEIRIFIKDMEANKTIKTVSHKISAKWIESTGQ